MDLASHSHHSPEELDETRPILKSLGKEELRDGWKVVGYWKHQQKLGGTLREIWLNLDTNVKHVFSPLAAFA